MTEPLGVYPCKVSYALPQVETDLTDALLRDTSTTLHLIWSRQSLGPLGQRSTTPWPARRRMVEDRVSYPYRMIVERHGL